MHSTLTSHLNFDGNARQALEFYHAVFHGSLSLVTYREAGLAEQGVDSEAIIWGQLISDNGFRVMAFDVRKDMPWSQGDNAFYLVLESADQNQAQRHWYDLSVGAEVLQPALWHVERSLWGYMGDKCYWDTVEKS
ncbi:VOC family protein [Pokkaliibacter sp. CJK22405]|uniref:VOC family protein n=1 Tax=Pokkaliibacter sp. CJK22405 TaxID=3384615 RepID=UPI0039848405